MKNQIFAILVICLGLGIFISDSLDFGSKLRIYFILVFFGLFLNQLIKNKLLNTLGLMAQIIVLGIIIHSTQNDETFINNEDQKEHIIHFKIIEVYKPSAKYFKYKVKNLTTNSNSLAYIPKSYNEIFPMDTLVVLGKTYALSKPLNPYQFDYSKYLKRQHISANIFVSDVLVHNSNHKHWKKLTFLSKKNIREKLKSEGFTTEARSIISSMLLGDRSEISQELNDSYILTGVVHILSISGLHVVMIFIILQFLLKPLHYIKNGRKLSIILALIIIWIFAFYVDLHPPVFRSALMISIYYISELLKRPKNIFHTISLSAFIILLIQPNNLFDVGFQLSFSAVFFIVWLNPIFKEIYYPRHKFSKYLYDLTSTSISAQFGTLPFAAYYFNQFSGLFLLGNLFLVPASFFMIIGAIIAILLITLDLNFQFYTQVFNQFIAFCNGYIKWLSGFDALVMQQVYINPLAAMLILIILICLRPLFLKKATRALLIMAVCFFILGLQRFISITQIRNSNEIIVFNQYKSSLIGIRQGQNLTIIHSENLDSSTTKQYIIKPFEVHNRIKNTSYIAIDSTLIDNRIFKSKSVLVINQNRMFIGENLNQIPDKIDYILIRNSSFDPNDLNNLPQIKRVIADGSNYPNYTAELEKVLENYSDSILWKTPSQGFYQIKF